MTNTEELAKLFPHRERKLRSHGDTVRAMDNENLADLIWNTLSGFPSYEVLLAWLNEPAKEESI